ncbi:MAG: hypothetical protein EOP04_30930, partial [Proteobacteria bacterium]
MNYLSRFMSALPPICAILAAGAAALGSSHSALASTPSFAGVFSPHTSQPQQSRDAFVQVGVTSTPLDSSEDLTKIGGFSTRSSSTSPSTKGGFSNLLGSTTPSKKGFRLANTGDPILIGFSTTLVETTEGQEVVLTVTRTSEDSTRVDRTTSVTVNYATSNINTTTPADYLSQVASLKFPGGTTSQVIRIGIKDDTEVEGIESFNVTLSLPNDAPSNARITNNTARVQIDDNDTSVQLAAANTTVNEADGTATVEVTRSGGVGAARFTYRT